MTLAIDPARVTRCLSIVVGLLVVASLGGQFSKRVLGHDRLLGLVSLFNLDYEGNIPSWYSSIALLLAAGLLMVIARASWSSSTRCSRTSAARSAPSSGAWRRDPLALSTRRPAGAIRCKHLPKRDVSRTGVSEPDPKGGPS